MALSTTVRIGCPFTVKKEMQSAQPVSLLVQDSNVYVVDALNPAPRIPEMRPKQLFALVDHSDKDQDFNVEALPCAILSNSWSIVEVISRCKIGVIPEAEFSDPSRGEQRPESQEFLGQPKKRLRKAEAPMQVWQVYLSRCTTGNRVDEFCLRESELWRLRTCLGSIDFGRLEPQPLVSALLRTLSLDRCAQSATQENPSQDMESSIGSKSRNDQHFHHATWRGDMEDGDYSPCVDSPSLAAAERTELAESVAPLKRKNCSAGTGAAAPAAAAVRRLFRVVRASFSDAPAQSWSEGAHLRFPAPARRAVRAALLCHARGRRTCSSSTPGATAGATAGPTLGALPAEVFAACLRFLGPDEALLLAPHRKVKTARPQRLELELAVACALGPLDPGVANDPLQVWNMREGMLQGGWRQRGRVWKVDRIIFV